MTAMDSSSRGRERSWREVAAAQRGVLSRQQALRSGLTQGQWRWQLDSERWQSVLPGVVVTHSGAVTAGQRAWAAVLAAGTGACLSGDAALVELGMRLPEGRVLDVAVPAHRLVTSPAFAVPSAASPEGEDAGERRVEVHRVTRLHELVHPVRSPPTVRLAPAVLHAAAWAPSDRAAEWRVAAAVQQRLVRPRDLRRTLAELPRLHRRALVTAVLDDVELGAHAAGELDFLRFLRSHRLPAPDRLQRPVRLGTLRYLDAWWERQRVGVELDGAHHRTVGTWEDDVLRSNDVMVAGRSDGTLLLRFSTGNLRHDGPRVAGQLRAVLL